MEKALKVILIIISILGITAVGLYYYFIYSMGHNFVHDKAASPEYYDHMANRIYFTTKYRGDKFDSLLNDYFKANPQYNYPDSANPLLFTDSCDCNCLPLRKIIYFNSPPKEAYQITYDLDTMYAGGAGVIDIVFISKDNQWICIKSSKLDSLQKARVKTRLDTAIIEKLPR
jgi:hypothetical protein